MGYLRSELGYRIPLPLDKRELLLNTGSVAANDNCTMRGRVPSHLCPVLSNLALHQNPDPARIDTQHETARTARQHLDIASSLVIAKDALENPRGTSDARQEIGRSVIWSLEIS